MCAGRPARTFCRESSLLFFAAVLLLLSSLHLATADHELCRPTESQTYGGGNVHFLGHLLKMSRAACELAMIALNLTRYLWRWGRAIRSSSLPPSCSGDQIRRDLKMCKLIKRSVSSLCSRGLLPCSRCHLRSWRPTPVRRI